MEKSRCRKPVLVWADDLTRLIFIEEEEAMERAQLWTALKCARTWGQFRRLVPDHEYQAVLDNLCEQHGLSRSCVAERAAEAGLSLDEVFQELTDLEIGFPPREDAKFDRHQIPWHDDGKYPSWPSTDMLGWVPAEVARLGYHAAGFDYEGLEFDPDRAEEVVAAFEAHGYVCRQDPELVGTACYGPREPDADRSPPRPDAPERSEPVYVPLIFGCGACGLPKEPAPEPAAAAQGVAGEPVALRISRS